MMLRPRQQIFVDNCTAALLQHGNTLGIAATGGGKTIMGAAIVGPMAPRGGVLVLQHRDELVAHNRGIFKGFNPNVPTDVINAEHKQWAKNGATFAMVQTLCRDSSLQTMPPNLACLMIDEAHHVAAESYQRIIATFRERSPGGRILGLTATPERGDKKALLSVFTNVGDKIGVSELVATGNLVPPKAFRINVGMDGRNIPRSGAEFDMLAVEALMDKEVVAGAIIEHWRALASERSTVVFASTIRHAQHLSEQFQRSGVTAAYVHSDLNHKENATVLAGFDRGEIRVLVNVMKLTEGWDCPRIGCVLLARPCSQKSTMIQMIGRGLRPCVDMEKYPGVVKDDCIVLDFGASLATHGDIDGGDRLVLQKNTSTGEVSMRACPECKTLVPSGCTSCPICGFEFFLRKKKALEDFTMLEVKILDLSPFQWEELFDGLVFMANGLDAWASVICVEEFFFACGGGVAGGAAVTKIMQSKNRGLALASADDFLRKHGDHKMARKTKKWLVTAPSDKQREFLGLPVRPPGSRRKKGDTMSRYRASCLLTWKFSKGHLRRLLGLSKTFAEPAVVPPIVTTTATVVIGPTPVGPAVPTTVPVPGQPEKKKNGLQSAIKKKIKKDLFYAVAVGRVVGMYDSWAECSQHTAGFQGAKYQRFDTVEAANAFILANRVISP